ncbi:MAG TPA: excisionase family DNA-binding protein [Chloroflexota bacterium]|nr:excisionase family DNA-binding protein [Chloroflexota bacterium]
MPTSRTITSTPGGRRPAVALVAAFSPKPLFSVDDAAMYLGVSASTVRRRIATGALRAHRWGRGWIMWRADLDRYRAQATSTHALPPLPLYRLVV